MRILRFLCTNSRFEALSPLTLVRRLHVRSFEELLYNAEDRKFKSAVTGPIQTFLRPLTPSFYLLNYLKLRNNNSLSKLKPTEFRVILRSFKLLNSGNRLTEREKETTVKILELILHDANELGIRLNIGDFTHILRIAMYIGHEPVADKVIKIVKKDELRPTVDYLNSVLGNYGGCRWSMNKFISPAWKGTPTQEPVSTAMLEAIDVDFPRNGLAPNSTTYDYLIIGLARDGKIEEIRDLLQRVWGISQGKPGERLVNRNNSLYPTSHTLLSVASAFGFLGDIPTAVDLCKELAKTYEIRFSELAWCYIIYWSTVAPKFKSAAGITNNSYPDIYSRMYYLLNKDRIPYPKIYQKVIAFYKKIKKPGLLERVCQRWMKHLMHSQKLLSPKEKERQKELLFREISFIINNNKKGNASSQNRIRVKWMNLLHRLQVFLES
ncbi:ATPase expression protein [Schizosaccharomyces cryophilus OY26]|uniref:ATPase expression protein n=1 Tax=Schizosaccharomyces cryophilus (strain OY26 / ATCC MYA-4695 / CBS 11777 / NBRC 106824 / NRRL Y48691) TaxID=653667 RepID=S9VYF5_SCHCR|nr:ATPase expression protein [Schizosaccharomyces cryophilus OY26]EPY51299.1 ATPase expression protein [Schizosaccharomyces cryophilus OY26]